MHLHGTGAALTRRTKRTAALLTLLGAVSLLASAPASADHVDDTRIGDAADPVAAAVDISRHTFGDGAAEQVVLGRDDVFADTLAGAALAGTRGPILYTTGGPSAALRPETLAEIQRVLGPPAGCSDGVEVTVLGGPNAVSPEAEEAVRALGYCVERVAGPSRVETSVRIAEVVLARAGAGAGATVVIARADDWADAATGGAFVAATGTVLVVTDRQALHPAVAALLDRVRPTFIELLGGGGALSPEVEASAGTYAQRVRRVRGAARDLTAVAIARALWGVRQGAEEARPHAVMLVNGYDPQAWAYAIAAAVPAALDRTPQLYVQPETMSEGTREFLASFLFDAVVVVGPPVLVGDAVADEAAALGPLTSPLPDEVVADDLVQRVQDERAARGLPPLVRVEGMECAAHESASGGVGDQPDLDSCGSWDDDLEAFGQFLASGFNSQAGSARIHVQSMAEARFREVVLQPGFDRIGVGTACSADGRELYVTYIVGRSADSTAPPIDQATPPAEPLARDDEPGARCDES